MLKTLIAATALACALVAPALAGDPQVCRTTFDADDYLVFTEYKNRERYHNGEKICPFRCEETGKASGLVFKLEGDTLHILNTTL
jgi:hypothetical protein